MCIVCVCVCVYVFSCICDVCVYSVCVCVCVYIYTCLCDVCMCAYVCEKLASVLCGCVIECTNNPIYTQLLIAELWE